MEQHNIGERIKELRFKLNLTQKELASKIGVTAAALSSYEKGITNPSIAVIIDIAKYANISVDWLLGLSDTKNFKIKTYADILRIINQLANIDCLKISMGCLKGQEGIRSNYCYDFIIDNSTAYGMFRKYVDVLKLHREGTITDDILAAVMEKLEKDYDISIEDNK